MGKAPTDQSSRPSAYELRENMASIGDLLGLIEHIETSRMIDLAPQDLEQVTRAVRRLAKENPDELTASVFALVLGLAGELLCRVRLSITRELKRDAQFGRGNPDLPPELEDRAWLLDRFERLSKFIADMASVRARLDHLRQLSETRDDPEGPRNRKPRFVRPLADDPGQAGSGEAAALSGRKRLRTA